MYTKLIGILNITPDSFSDGGHYMSASHALLQTQKLIDDGASVIDIGAESTRPGATPLTAQEEWQRLEIVLPEIIQLLQGTEVQLSVDTYHPETADRALALGVDIINDVSGCVGTMPHVLAAYDAPIILMHNMGIPADKNCLAEVCDPVKEVYVWAEQKLEQLEKENIARKRIILDPGIGFGKNADQSLALLRGIDAFKALGVPLCIGHSRKSFLAGFSAYPAADRDTETLAVSLYLAQHGVDYLRVHDVEKHHRALTVFSLF